MDFRLKTTKNASDKSDELQRVLKLQSKAAVMRLGIGLSLKDSSIPNTKLDLKDGFELQKATITGEDDDLFRLLITQHTNKKLSYEEYFPTLLNAHIERGVNLLYSEYELLGNKDKLIKYLLSVGD